MAIKQQCDDGETRKQQQNRWMIDSEVTEKIDSEVTEKIDSEVTKKIDSKITEG